MERIGRSDFYYSENQSGIFKIWQLVFNPLGADEYHFKGLWSGDSAEEALDKLLDWEMSELWED